MAVFSLNHTRRVIAQNFVYVAHSLCGHVL